MKCEQCGNEIESIMINQFRGDGSDTFIDVPILECENNAVSFETNINWTGYELSESEQLETVACPQCGKFPFKDKEIQAHEVVRLVCFKSN